MGLFNSPVMVRVVTESGRIISERLIPGGERLTITVPDDFADRYYLKAAR